MRRIDRILQISIGALLCVFVFVIFLALHERIVQVGDSAPEFSITTDTGRTITANNFGGRVLVLNFWATWCPPCIEELPSLDQFARRMKDSGVVVLGVSVDEDEGAYKRFLEKNRPSFLVARDAAAAISDSYGTYRYPETYVIGAD